MPIGNSTCAAHVCRRAPGVNSNELLSVAEPLSGWLKEILPRLSKVGIFWELLLCLIAILAVGGDGNGRHGQIER